MKNILLLTDFSKNALNAVNYAIKLFGDNCNYNMLHVKSSTSYTTDDILTAGNESIYETFIKTAKEKLEQLAIELKVKFKSKNLKIETIVDFDVLTDAINQVVKSREIDLVVMGTNGITGAKEVIFGSNTINVIRKVDCDTLVIPEDFKFREINEIVLPLDSLDSIIGRTFTRLLQFVKNYESKIHLLRINQTGSIPDSQLKDRERIKNFTNEISYSYNIVNNVPMHYAVSSFIQTHKIDLMILIEQKELTFERFFMGSTTTKIGNNLTVPLLVFHI